MGFRVLNQYAAMNVVPAVLALSKNLSTGRKIMKSFASVDATSTSIGGVLERFQASLGNRELSFSEFLSDAYVQKWKGEQLAHALKVRTALVLGLQEFLVSRGILNIDRVSLSPVTDPLCQDVEHVPIILYQDTPYRTTHSMIYSKMLACLNPYIEGIYVDSPNIRLELPSLNSRHKYLIDFSQMDIEFKRAHKLSEDDYFDRPKETAEILSKELDRALDFFEDLIIYSTKKIFVLAAESLEALGVKLTVPSKPFPRFYSDEIEVQNGCSLEEQLGQKAKTQFFWVLGLLRENYDLVYPYLSRDGRRPSKKEISPRQVFNYDLCAAPLYRDGSLGHAYEILSGGLREWVYEAIVERLLDNAVLRESPRFDRYGNLENMAALDGYGPFLSIAHMRDSQDQRFFPQVCGGGLGIERTLFALLQGPFIKDIDEVTCFGKNPDKTLPFLF
jgi:asparaginyl-tRNA synthetase